MDSDKDMAQVPQPALAEVVAEAAGRLRKVYPEGEARMMVRIIFEQLKGYTQTDMIMKATDPVSPFIQRKVGEAVDRLLRNEPIQYIFQSARFYGLNLKVTPAVLIPRQETEELVDMIVRDADGQTDLRVLDLCTGSGCIAVALGRNLVFPSVEGVDISEEALEVARENAKNLKVNVRFEEADVLNLPPQKLPTWDVIVSNPPYVLPDEKTSMPANVLDFEPARALFVPEDNPLIFYKAIERYALTALRPGRRIYFEINPLEATALRDYMISAGWQNVELLPDDQKKLRFLRAQKPED